jgi:PII-like signaling protein
VETPRDAVLLRAFIGGADRENGHAVYRSIIDAAFKAGLSGATALHGPLGYGQTRRLNSEFIVDAPGNLPVVIEIIDSEEKIEGFLTVLDELIGSGLVTLERVRMARIGRQTKEPTK